MDSGAVCGALSRKSPVKSESLARGGVMTMTLCGNLVAALLVCLCFVWVARLAVVVCRVWSCFHDNIASLYGFSAGSPANEPVNSLLLFNKMRQNCLFYFKKKAKQSAQLLVGWTSKTEVPYTLLVFFLHKWHEGR
jgi:hypothetical protein